MTKAVRSWPKNMEDKLAMDGKIIPDIFDDAQAAAFLKAYCEKGFLHIEQEDRTRFEHLFTWDAINKLLSLNLLDAKRMRVVKDGRDVPLAFYRRDDENKTIDPRKLAALMEQGGSIAINAVQQFSEGVSRLAAQFERWLNQRLNVNMYLSFGTGGAFTSHFDTHDVLALQIHGEKLWTIYEDPEPYPRHELKTSGRHAARGRKVLCNPFLRAGDLIYFPRGFYHEAAVQDGFSVHMTFGLRTAVGMHFVDDIRRKCLETDLFRMDVHEMSGPQALAEQEQALKAELHRIVDSYSLTEMLEARKQKRQPIDQFQLGPKPDLNQSTVLVPRLRHSDVAALPRKVAEETTNKVVSRLIENKRMTFSELTDSFGDEYTVDDLRTAVKKLFDEHLLECI